MFLDEETESAMRKAGHLDGSKKAGIWRIVIVHNVPFVDARRTGKVNHFDFMIECPFCQSELKLFCKFRTTGHKRI